MLTTNSTILPTKINKSVITSIYKTFAPIYDIAGLLIETKARQRCVEVAQIRDGESVLEVAVGTGLTFAEILKRNPSGRNEGIDLTKEMLEQAIRRVSNSDAKNYRLAIGDAYKLEFADNTFDLVVNNYMFDLLPENDFSAVLSEFKRVLRPGGRLVLVNMGKGSKWFHHIAESLYRINPMLAGGCREVALLEYVQAAGFSQATREFISQMTFPSEVVYGRKP